MAVLYRGPRALVTHDVFAVARTEWHRFAVRDLTRICIVRQSPNGVAGGRVMALSAAVVAVVSIPLAGRASLVPALVILAAAGCCLIWTRIHGCQAEWQLVALHRGRLTILFSSRDEREFAQVCRALRRVLEEREEN
jgi:hypothetical protein